MKKNTLVILICFVIIISLVLISNLFFQKKEDIKSILSAKELSKFENFIKQKFEEDVFNGHWKYLRDITYEYKEGIFEFKQYIKDNKGRNTTSYEVFQVKIIASGNQIIFYEFSVQKNKKVKYEWKDSFSWEPYYVSIEKFKNDEEYKKIKNNFKKIFGSDLNESELFMADIVYGGSCGAGAMYSSERMQLNSFVDKKDKISILKWLKSTNAEKQIYAVEGLLKLKKMGIVLNKTELGIIKYITHKKGTIKVCNGCIYSSKELSEVIKLFEL
ncbi:hypothetical protein LXD69_11535 [Flavobacterium sediminilitoris]|uniref:Uncharacterized protein n=1 Tax=Flavobacterium sediminilitoris TaxID=2024526 RepID=A0ABY4HJI9_9FLAO|nr:MULTISPECIES: hypothetical protein [Flavobacterium]UOX32675.1 hypothetical protein LXD69_11535 [Flavobacterium sediminilitoris]